MLILTSFTSYIAIAIVRPHLEYASQVRDPYLLKDQQTFEIVQKFAC